MLSEHKIGDLLYNRVYDKLGYISEFTYGVDGEGTKQKYYKVFWLGRGEWEFEYHEDSIDDFKSALERRS